MDLKSFHWIIKNGRTQTFQVYYNKGDQPKGLRCFQTKENQKDLTQDKIKQNIIPSNSNQTKLLLAKRSQ